MYREFIREISGAERESLQDCLKFQSPVSAANTVKWMAVWLGAILLLVLLAVGLVVLDPHPVIGIIIGGIIAVFGLISLYAVLVLPSSYFHWRGVHRTFLRETVPAIEETLSKGKVHVKHVVADNVIEIPEFEDEGSGYIFDIGDGQSLLLKGQMYSIYEEDTPWPASEFEIVRGENQDMWIGIFPKGEALTPVQTVEMEDCKEKFIWSEREEVIQQNPEEVLKGLLRSDEDADEEVEDEPDEEFIQYLDKWKMPGFFFWALAPFLVLFMIALPIMHGDWDRTKILTISGLEMFSLLMLLGLLHARKFFWAWRGVGALIFVATLGYLVDTAIPDTEGVGMERGQSILRMFGPIMATFFFGLPGIWFAVTGRLSLKKKDDLLKYYRGK